MKTMFHLGQTEHIAFSAQLLLKSQQYGHGQTLPSTFSTMTQRPGYTIA